MRQSILTGCLLVLALNPNIHAAVVDNQGTWKSTLQGRDLDGDLGTIEAYYDTVLDITWLADANASGYLDWHTANTWASSLDFNGITGWRLPKTGPVNGTSYDYSYTHDGSTDRSFNISAPGSLYPGSKVSEMAHLFYNTLGNKAFYDANGNANQPGWGLTNSGPLSNLHSSFNWSQTSLPDDLNWGIDVAWGFDFGDGNQGDGVQSASAYALAVHDGDVGTTVVPAPAALWLFGSGLLGMVGVARQKKTR